MTERIERVQHVLGTIIRYLEKQPDALDAHAYVAGLVDSLSCEELLSLEYWSRRRLGFSLGYSLIEKRVETMPPQMVALLSWYSDGRVRERAVAQLRKRKDGAEIKYLLIRITDWVFVIRDDACKAVRERLTAENAKQFAALVPMMLQLKGRAHARATHVQLITEILDFLTSPAQREALRSGLNSPHATTRRECLILLFSHGELEPEELRQIMESKEPGMRRRAVESAARSDAMAVFVKDLLRDKQANIRAIALDWFRINRRTEAPSALQAALLDKSASLRDYARYWVMKTDPNFDVREFYLEQLQSSHKTVQAIAGLGETGVRDDVVQLLLPLESPSPRVVAAAITAIGRLDAAKYMETLLPYTLSGNSSVRKAACEALVPHASSLNVAELCMAYANHNADVQRALLRLIKALPKWDRLGCALFAMEHSADIRARDHAADIVTTWIGRNHTEWAYNLPTPQQWARIMQGWKDVKGKLPEALESRLDDVLSELQRLMAARSS